MNYNFIIYETSQNKKHKPVASKKATKSSTAIPNCSVPGCDNLAVQTLGKSHPRYPTYRRSNWIKELHPTAKDTWCCYAHHQEYIARSNGYDSVTEFRNSRHPYLKYRKDYCENRDGRLGFKCNTVLPTQEMLNAAGLKDWRPKQLLEVDHKDGNHTHNDPSNLQTLCKHCHTIKSYVNGDHLTPGRKTRKLLSE